MISFRFNKARQDLEFRRYFIGDLIKILVSSLEKPFGLESPMSSNFLYGRPALEPSILRTTHSSMNDSIRPVGIYYEDDSPYINQEHQSKRAQEVKSIYLGADTLNTGSTNGTDASDNSDKQRQPLVELCHSRETTLDRATQQQNNIKDFEQCSKQAQQHMYLGYNNGSVEN